MRISSALSVAAAVIIVFAASSSQVCRAQAPNIHGIWTGMTTFANSTNLAPLEADIAQNGSSLSGTARLYQSPVYYVGSITGSVGTAAALTINFGAYGTMSASLAISGTVGVGKFVVMSGSDPVFGNVALNLQVGLTTANIQGSFGGNSLNSVAGGTAESSTINVIQRGDTIEISTMWDGKYFYFGTGTIIGNKITFQVTQLNGSNGSLTVINGTANVSGNVISGIITLGTETGSSSAIGAFSVTADFPIT